MATKLEAQSNQKNLQATGTPVLPVLQEGRATLVSPPQGERTPSFKDAAAQWSLDVRRRIETCLESGEDIDLSDLQELYRELITSFITALQKDSHTEWMLLCEKLTLLYPYQEILKDFDNKSELFHYLERIIHHVDLHKERLFDVQISTALHTIFPKEVKEIRDKGRLPLKNYCMPTPPLVRPPCSPRKIPKSTLPDGTDPFDLRPAPDDETYLVVKPLSFGDLRKSFGAVAMEVASREAVWGQSLGTTVQSLSTNIPEQHSPIPEETKPESVKSTVLIETQRSPRKTPDVKKQVSPRKPMTGREAVQYFAGCHHVGKIETLFFNTASNRHYRPYDLIEVPQNKVAPEHFVFSTFSILHVYPDQPNEKLSLDDWQKEAVLWNAISHIPFFKNFLIMKTFKRWLKNKRRLDFLRRKETLNCKLLQSVPRYGAALLQISRLLKELVTVNFIPLDDKASYSLLSFENFVNYRNKQADKTLEKFFNYCKLTADVTAEETFKLLAFCEEQVQKKSVFSKDSLHLQRLKKEQREANLKKAKRETGNLGNLVKLMDQMVIEHLFEITKSQVGQFVNVVMKSRQDADRDGKGMLQVNLVFTKQDVLGLSPTKEKILSEITETLKNIPSVLCARAVPLDSHGAALEQDDVVSEISSRPKSAIGLVKSLDLKRKKSSAMTPSTVIGSEPLPDIQTLHAAEKQSLCQSEAASIITQSARSKLDDIDPLALPDLPKWAEPQKEDDELGVATPDLVIKRDTNLRIEGAGFMGQYEPLSRASLEEKLYLDQEFQGYLESTNDMLEAAMFEVDQYCEANSWLNPIHEFASQWTDRSVKGYAGLAAFAIEQKLNELRQWSERIRNFDQSFLTENGLVYVDCVHIHEELLPQLDKIYQQLITFVAEEMKRLSKEFCKDISFIVYTLKDKKKNVEAFAKYAKSFHEYKRDTPQYQQQLDYIKSLFEVIRMSYRQLTSDEEKLEESVWQAWESFLFQMQSASEFVNTQTPLFSQELENTYTRLKHAKTQKQQSEAAQPPSRVMMLEKEAYELADRGTSGIFLNPQQNPSEILAKLKEIRMKFFSVREQLMDASWRREAISGDTYDLTFLAELTKRLDMRYELWKYVEVSALAIKDWKNLLFKKLNTRKVLEKMVEWQTAAGHLKVHLPQSDEVLAHWFRSLQDFKTKLPLLHKLRHESLKEHHWRAIFVGIGDVYDSRRELLVHELLDFNLNYNDKLIDQICQNALGEFDLEVQVQKLAKFWREREFKLAMHIPDSVYNSKDLQHRRRQNSRRKSKLERFRLEKEILAAGKCLDVTSEDFYILIDVDQLQYELEDSQISVHAMLNSPHLASMEQEVKYWSKTLSQIQEITDLWLTSQEKWLYLLKVFEQSALYRKYPQLSFKFENLHKKLKDHMWVVSHDPKCMSVLNHRRGEKGFRLLQGDNLRSLLTSVITTQEEILKQISQLLDEARLQFPRLYFLSDSELVGLLGVSRNPQGLMPAVSKCFPGVKNIKFSLPPGMDSLNATLDYTLHADKLYGRMLQGNLGETVMLSRSLEPQSQATTWLSTLENLMRNSLAENLQETIQTRMDGAIQPSEVLNELINYNTEELQQGGELDEESEVFNHWLLKYPAQCVMISEGVLWEKAMTQVLNQEDKHALNSLLCRVQSRLDEYLSILKAEIRGKVDVQVKNRLRSLMSNLVNQNIYLRDVMTVIAKSANVSLETFDWLKVLKYHIDIKSVLRAKTEISEATPVVTPTTSPLNSARLRKKSVPEKVESPMLARTKTTVSSVYSFSQCYVHMFATPYSYDYEYLGPCSRLVVTPLTERAFISLSSSLQSFHCGALVGPSATGKSQTVRELSRTLGRHLVTVNCNEEVTLPMITQYLSGMLQTGNWVLFDNAGSLTTGLLSVMTQHMDYLRTALKSLSDSDGSQYNLRGQPRYDKFGRRVFYDIDPVCKRKKPGTSDKVIRRNSLTTLHPLPPDDSQPSMLRQNTVPHGFNEKGLSTYFEDRWIEEREERRHSIEKEILIKESELYKSNKPPPLFYEHVVNGRKKSSPDYSKLGQESSYQPSYLGNVLFNGRLLSANVNYGCFMTFNSGDPSYSTKLPAQFRLLIRPCALVVPDTWRILEVLLYANGYEEAAVWTNKLTRFLTLINLQMPHKLSYQCVGIQDLKTIITVAGEKRLDRGLDREIHQALYGNIKDDVVQTQTVYNREEFCLVYALRQLLLPRMENEDDSLRLQNVIRDLFPSMIRTQDNCGTNNSKLKQTIMDLLVQNHQFYSEEFVNKILQLETCMEFKQGAILVGPSGSGKTTCYQTLAKAWNYLNYQLFAPDHSNEQIDIHKMIQTGSTQIQKENEDTYDFKSLEIKEVIKLQTLERDDTEARSKWKKAEKDLISMLNTKTDIESLGGEKCVDYAIYPKVDLYKVTPNALTTEQLFGSFEKGIWSDGLLTKTLRGMESKGRSMKTALSHHKVNRSNLGGTKVTSDLPSYLLQWVILDGEINPCWSENLNTLLDEHRRLCSADRENITFQDSATVLFETTDLSFASPAMIARTCVLHFPSDLVQWKWLYDSWADTCKTTFMITSSSLKMLDDLVTDVFGPSLKFLANECVPSLVTDTSLRTRLTNQVGFGIQEVTSFLKMLSSLLSKSFLREELEKKLQKINPLENKVDEDENGRPSTLSRSLSSRLTTTSVIEEIIPNHLELIKSMFAFSYVWAFGGSIHDRYKEAFNDHAREVLYRSSHPIRIPTKGSVFDYHVDITGGGLVRWVDRPLDRPRGLAPTYVITPEVGCYHYLMDLLLVNGHSVLLTGATGVGKTSFVQNVIGLKHKLTRIHMSGRLTSDMLRSRLADHLQELPPSQPIAASGSSLSLDERNLTFFIDDLNTAPLTTGIQSPLELLRQVLTDGGLYDTDRKSMVGTREANYLAVATTPSQPGTGFGVSSHTLSSRLTRLMVTLTHFSLAPESVLSVIRKPLLNWLEEFPTYSVEHHQDFADAMSLGLLELYEAVKEKLRPTPAHAHYLFSFHDVARTVQGLLLMSPRSRTRKIRARRRERDDSRSRAMVDALEMLRQTSNVSSVSGVSMESSAPMMKTIAQLWCHECNRVFADRLVAHEDFVWYQKNLETIAVKHFCTPRENWQKNMGRIEEEVSGRSMGTPLHTPGGITPSDTASKGTSPMAVNEHDPVEMPDFEISRPASANSQHTSDGGTRQEFTPQGLFAPDSRVSSVPGEQETDRVQTESETQPTTARSQESSGDLQEGVNDTLGNTTDTETGRTELSSEEEESSTEENLSTIDDSESETSELARSRDFDTSLTASKDQMSMENLLNSSQTPRRQSKQGRRGVTFKMGLILDSTQDSYDGPLMTLEELKGEHKNLTDVIFSKYFMRIYTEAKSLMVERGYVESNETKLTEALYLCLKNYNTATSQHLDMAFFSQAVKHAARLSRALAFPGGHAMLLGLSYSTGRSMLTKLAAYIAQRQVFEPKPQSTAVKTLKVVREHIKRCCHNAGVMKKATVLLIKESLGEDCLRDVACVMQQGTCPGLYNEDESQDLISQMMPGGVQTKRVDKIEQAFERFLRNVRQNLHVVLCINYKGNSFSSDFKGLQHKLEICPSLLKHCVSIDVYKQWDKQAYVTIATRWLTDNKAMSSIPWNESCREDQIALTSSAMSYIHLSAKATVEQQYSRCAEPLRFYTPLTFREFTHMFRIIALHLAQIEQSKIDKYEVLLGKVNDAFSTIAGYKREISDLTPHYNTARETIQDWVEKVEEGKKGYKEELDQCKAQEELIADLQKPMENLRTKLSSAFDKAKPSYEAAKLALSSLDENAGQELGELKSYRQPPETVQWVVGAICVLFDRKEGWESGKQLLLKENLIHDLIFYDKEHIPPHIFNKLEKYVRHPRFTPEEVCQASAALGCVCSYIHAVYHYAVIHKGTFPIRQNLDDAVTKVDKAQMKLGQMRLAASRSKTQLEKSIDNYKDAMKSFKNLEKQIASFEKRVRKCNDMMLKMKPHHTEWKTEVKKAKANIETAPADALITAACVCYFGPLDDKSREELVQDWVKFCLNGPVTGSSEESVTARLDHFMEENLSVYSQGGEAEKVGLKMDDSLEGLESDRVDASPSPNDNPPPVQVYRYRPSIQESSISKGEMKSEHGDSVSALYSSELEDSDTEGDPSPLKLRKNPTLQWTLSSLDELQGWKLQGLPTDLHATQNALIMKVCCNNREHFWPLLVDPDHQAEGWIRALQHSPNNIQQPDLTDDTSDTDSLRMDLCGNEEPIDRRMSRMSNMTGFTEYTSGDETLSMISRAQTSASNPTKGSDSLRPVTSVTQSLDSYTGVKVEEELLTPPVDKLWVVESDHPDLNYYLLNAVVHGVTVLVTHLERQPLDPVFRGILFKQHHLDKDGRKVVRIGPTHYNYHPEFRLYLSTSTPLFSKGDGLIDIPIEKMCVINLALSDEAIISKIMDETMAVERREFHTQLKANNRDIIHHNQMLLKVNDAISDKVLDGECTVLKDRTLLPSLDACQTQLEKHRSVLEEISFTRDSLESKMTPYVAMATEVAMLYALMKKMTVLHPFYYLPFYKFLELFKKVLKSRDRGKGVAGDMLARSQELSDATTASLHKYVTLMMMGKHTILFSMLVAMERLRLKGQLTNQEMALFINGFEVSSDVQQGSSLADKPDWLSEEAWNGCVILESLHDVFHGLQTSLDTYSKQWQEYFSHPLAVMNPVPGVEFKHLTVFQKCLLWKVISPEKLSMVAQSLSVYELGAIVQSPGQWSVKEVFDYTDHGTPAIFIQPERPAGFSMAEPCHELKRLAREHGMESRFKILHCGVESQVTEMKHLLKDCMKNGYWLLLENYHLSQPLDTDMFQLFKMIVESHQVEDTVFYDNDDDDSYCESTPNNGSRQSELPGLVICPSFRLFITTASTGGQILPSILIQHGVKVNCEATPNFRHSLQKSYRNVAYLLNNKLHTDDVEEKSRFILPIALFHSILLHRRYYANLTWVKPMDWSLVDLVSVTNMFKTLSVLCDSPDVMSEVMTQIYSNHCTDPHDAKVVKSIGMATLIFPKSQQLPGNIQTPSNLLQQIMSSDGQNVFSLKSALDSVHEWTSSVFNLPPSVDDQLTKNISRDLGLDLVMTVGAPELQVKGDNHCDDVQVNLCLKELEDCVEDCDDLPETNRDELYPLDIFYHYQIEEYKALLAVLQNDLDLLNLHQQGKLTLSPDLKQIYLSLCSNKVPEAWADRTQITPSGDTAMQWMERLPDKLRSLSSYVRNKSSTVFYDLSVFLRPTEFLHAALQDYARQHFKNAEKLRFEAKVMPHDFKATSPPETGLYLSHLYLHNAGWDRTRGQLTELSPHSCHQQYLPIIWLCPVEDTPSRASSANSANSTSNTDVYFCPVFNSQSLVDRGHDHLITRIAMATGHTPPAVWTEKQVFISPLID